MDAFSVVNHCEVGVGCQIFDTVLPFLLYSGIISQVNETFCLVEVFVCLSDLYRSTCHQIYVYSSVFHHVIFPVKI